MKRIFCITFISIVCSFSFLTGYCSLYSVPVYGAQDDWETLTSNEQLVDAFRAYCKSRNIFIDGSVADGVTSFTTKTFNNICNALGIDMTLLQAEIQRKYTGTGYRFAFSASGLNGFNRICAEFLQNNDLSVGESVDNKTIYEGTIYTDDDGNSCLVYHADTYYSAGSVDHPYWTITGSPLKYSQSQLISLGLSSSPAVFNCNGVEISCPLYPYNEQYVVGLTRTLYGRKNNSIYVTLPHSSLGYEYLNGYISVCAYDNDSVNTGLWLSIVGEATYEVPSQYHYDNFATIARIPDSENSEQDCNIFINSNNSTITNQTVINEGDTYYIDSDGQPDSGGGGDQDPDQGDDWDPVLPDIPDGGDSPSGGNTIDWPDLDLPDFDLPNFSLGDLRLKFPFSIPFDIVSILGVINADPVAPVIQEDIPIRIDLMNVDYTIPINLDMSDTLYDNFAKIVRAVEFIGFCIGLIHLTIRLVKG